MFSPGVSRLGDSRQDAWHPAPGSLLCQCHTSTLLNNLLHHRATITKVTRGGCHRRTLGDSHFGQHAAVQAAPTRRKVRAKDERGVQASRSTSRFWFVQSDGGKKSGSEIIEHISEIKQIFEFGLKERGRNRVRQKKKFKKNCQGSNIYL